jgi:pimeloyl-ACP methyl ester carboxylesterase
MLQGEADLVTPPEVSRAYFDSLTAPNKTFIPMPRTGHDPNARMIDTQFEVLKAARAAAMAADRR